MISTQREATVYPPNCLAGRTDLDIIGPEQAGTLAAMFRARVRRTPDKIAYGEFDAKLNKWREYSWQDIANDVARWQAALEAEGLKPGDTVALRLRNSRHWVIFDQAALGLGLVTVPLYVDDRADNAAYILNHADVKLLFIETEEQWHQFDEQHAELQALRRVIVLGDVADGADARLLTAADWLPPEGGELRDRESGADELASVVYTSGTTGRPKGVMLSHGNMLSNAHAGLCSVAVTPEDSFLSFLPMSHTLERTAGYYMAMMAGAKVSFARSIPDLAEDLLTVKPTILISVPRIFERVYAKINAQLAAGSPVKRALFNTTVNIGWRRFLHRQGRAAWTPSLLLWPLLNVLVARKIHAKLGGRMRIAISGGAPLPPAISRVFIGLGVNLLQGYGLTESSPVISVNTTEHNVPESIGLPVHGVRVRIGDKDELLAKGPNIMLGYLKNEEATRAAIDGDGWLHTGDKAKIENGFIYITGRLKEIIVLANGEKVPPADMEAAIAEDPLFEQSMVIGEGRPYLAALLVLNRDAWRSHAQSLGVDPDDEQALASEPVQTLLVQRVADCLRAFPGYAQIHAVTATFEPWTVENGLTTPTMKMKRARIEEHFGDAIARMYEGH